MHGLLNDVEIARLCDDICAVCDGGASNHCACTCGPMYKPMITPFVKEQTRWVGDPSCLACTDNSDNSDYDHIPSCDRHKAISFGLSSFGYDLRVAHDFEIFSNLRGLVVDPKQMDLRMLERMRAEPVLGPKGEHLGSAIQIPPNSFALGRSVETFTIPKDVMVVVVGKSTLARCGLIVNVTPLEAGWTGQVTLEISNTTPCPARIYAGEGLAQCLFFRGTRPKVTYADRKGKYQNQLGIVPARL